MSDIEIHLFQKREYNLVFLCFFLAFLLLTGRLIYLTVFRSEELSKRALSIEQRERTIKAARGKVYDRNGIVLADNQAVCSVSVIYYQIKEPEKVIRLLSQKLAISEKEVRKKVEKISSREKIKSNVPKAIADEIREAGLSGVKVDEDYKRYYPFGTLASKVLGFAGADNQGILGLESRYDSTLKGTDGKILTMTDYQGIEVENLAEDRIEPVSGDDLYLSLDYNIQCYVQQAAKKVLKAKKAKRVSAILMNPQNGEIYALVSLPEYDLNEPFTLIEEYKEQGKTQNDKLNNMWRNPVISDSYEPGSTFKIVTATAALEEKKVTLQDSFFCSGFKLVEDRKIRCHKTQGHGAETFQQGFMNSCNPVFMEVGARLGVDNMFHYLQQLGIMSKTGIDVPGEASTIMHRKENVGAVELATMSFGQSFQLTPVRLLSSISMILNGGTRITPHLGVELESSDGTAVKKLTYPAQENIISSQTSETMRMILEKVVSEGTGKNAYIEGYAIGGKTAINFAGIKNEIGAFHQPRAVVLVPELWRTLPYEQLASGYGEILKTALLQGPDQTRQALLAGQHLADGDQDPFPLELVLGCARFKQKIVGQDPHDQGLRRQLNLGHTYGHAIESYGNANGRPISHGHAVAIGLVAALALDLRYALG